MRTDHTAQLTFGIFVAKNNLNSAVSNEGREQGGEREGEEATYMRQMTERNEENVKR